VFTLNNTCSIGIIVARENTFNTAVNKLKIKARNTYFLYGGKNLFKI
jgi:hypothetical protein